MTSLPPRQLACLVDIFNSAQAIQSYVAGQTREEFMKDSKTQDAVLRRFLVAGEAAARLTVETCNQLPSIPFGKIAGMRNRLIHGYDIVDFDVLWTVLQRDLPALIAELEKIVTPPGSTHAP